MKKVLRLGLLVTAAILMSSCIKFVTNVNEDGSGTWAFALLFSADTFDTVDDIGLTEPGENIEAISALLNGETIIDELSGIAFTGEERLENGHHWLYIVAEINSIEDWSEVLEAYQRVFPEDDVNPIISAMSPPDVVIDGDTVRVEADMIFEETGPVDEFEAMTTALVQYSFEFVLPGELIDHNGTIDPLTGNPVWVMPGNSQEDAHFFAESRIE